MTDTEPTTPQLPDIEGDFWTARTYLQKIFHTALAGYVSPWAVLGNVLARVIARTNPAVTLPPPGGQGTPGSINMLVITLGRPSAGKGRASGIAAKLMPVDGVAVRPGGSYEGMTKMFGHNVFNQSTKLHEWQWRNRNVLFNVTEIDQLAGVSSRTGDMSNVFWRQMWSGEDLGNTYADPTKQTLVTGGEYRASAVIHAQPAKTGWLFDTAGGGLVHRFLWFPASDGRAGNANADHVVTVAADGDLVTDVIRAYDRKGVIDVADAVTREVDEAIRRRAADESLFDDEDDLGGHQNYNRLKVAAALAFLANRQHITEDDWRLASTVMDVTVWTRNRNIDALTAARAKDAERRGHERGVERVATDEARKTTESARIVATARRVVTFLLVAPNRSGTTREIRAALSKTQRTYLGAALDGLVEEGLLDREHLAAPARGGLPTDRFSIRPSPIGEGGEGGPHRATTGEPPRQSPEDIKALLLSKAAGK